MQLLTKILIAAIVIAIDMAADELKKSVQQMNGQ
jgi:hypothetical protein